MSKRIVKKKAEASAAKNGTPAPPTDARVAQQMRVLEVVGANKGAEKQDQKYSPRTETHIKQLLPVLDFFEYNRNDIAAMVRRCHYDEQQIENTVANIVEDRQNHESSQWSVMKGKKQIKEEKKLKEEEEKKEQDRVERELEKQRKDAEKRAAKELAGRAAAAASRHGGKMSHTDPYADNGGADAAVTNPVTLPPDPAIIFAGAKPGSCETASGGGGGKDEWWDGFAENWATAEWDNNKDDSGAVANGAEKNWEGGNDWDWKKGRWEEDEWNDGGGGGKGDEAWWDGDWQKAGSGGRGKKGPKENRGGSKKEPKDLADMWDMPDTAADPNSGSLDQWALGDIRAHERRVAGATSDGAAEHTLPSLPKMPPESRTVEELEREQLGAGLPPPGRPPPSAPPPGGKSPIDMLLQEASGAGAGNAGAAEKPDKPSGKGKGKSKGERGGKGGDRGERPDRGDRGDRGERGERGERSERPRRDRADTDGDGGDERGDKAPIERLDRSDDPRRQAIEEVGENVTVRKHSSMGCAVITMADARVREAVLAAVGGEVIIAGTRVQLKPHHDKETHKEVPTDIFAAWGRQAEKSAPLPEREIMKFFEAKHIEFNEACRAEEEKSRLAEERARAQKLLEEQQRQQEEQRAREEERRRFEQDLVRRRQAEEAQRAAEAQRKALEDQKRFQEEQVRIHNETKAKWINDLQGNWAAQHAGGMPGHSAAAGAHDPRRAAAASLGAGAMNSFTAAAGGASAATAASAAQTRADQMSASAAGLNPAASAYPNPQAAAAQQWQAAQWMQAMYTAQQQQQQGWQQQMAHAQAAQQQRGMSQQMANGMGGIQAAAQQDYEQQLRAQAAYYGMMADTQHRMQSAAAYAQQQQQGGYTMSGGQQSTFGYGAAAAYGRGERI